MSPALPPTPSVDRTDEGTLTGSTCRPGSTVTDTGANLGNTASNGINGEMGGGLCREGTDAEAAAALEAGDMMSFAIEAGDGLNEDDAAELNAILQQVSLRRGSIHKLCREKLPSRPSSVKADGLLCHSVFEEPMVFSRDSCADLHGRARGRPLRG